MRPALSAWAVICLVTTGTTVRASSPDGGEPLVHVIVSNYARIPEKTLQRALDSVSDTMRAAGVPLVWSQQAGAAVSCALRIIIQPRLLSLELPPDEFVMGVAPGGGVTNREVAFIFYDQVRRVSQEVAQDEALVLRLAIVHELGHLLLPYPAHTATGVMRAHWDRAAVREATVEHTIFSARQGTAMRAMVGARTLGRAGCHSSPASTAESLRLAGR